MKVDSEKVIASLEKMKDGGSDTIGRIFDRGIQCAISLIRIYEEYEIGKEKADGNV